LRKGEIEEVVRVGITYDGEEEERIG